jgi:hypothetical protein
LALTPSERVFEIDVQHCPNCGSGGAATAHAPVPRHPGKRRPPTHVGLELLRGRLNFLCVGAPRECMQDRLDCEFGLVELAA